MKLLNISIHNIASIADAEIDFTSPPLEDADIFLISGVTGTGKSTILDAICLSLYGTTPRLDNSPRDHDNDNLSLNDPRRLMSRSATECFVMLRFEAQGRTFLAQWSVKRAHRKLTGKLQRPLWTLTDEADGSVLTKSSEVSQRIVSLTGLDFAQFTRTTLLSQGEFASFLLSKGEEKAALLQKITGIDRFEKIGRRVYELTCERRDRLDALQRDHAKLSIETLDDVQIESLHGEEQILSRRRERCLTMRQQVSADLEWATTLDLLQRENDVAQEGWLAAQAGLQREDYIESCRQMTLYDESTDVRRIATERAAAAAVLRRAERNRVELRANFAKARGAVAQMRALLANVKKRQLDTATQLESFSSRQQIYDQSESILTRLNQIQTLRNTLRLLNAKIVPAQKQIDLVLRPTLQRCEEEELRHLTLLESQRALMQAAQMRTDSAGLKKMRHEKESLSSRLSRITQTLQLSALCEQDVATIANMRTVMQKEAAEIEPAMLRLVEAEKRVDDSERLVALTQSRRDAFHLAASDAVEAIRATLHPGDECPVCGRSIETPVPVMERLQSLLRKAQQELADAEAEHTASIKRKEREAAFIATTKRVLQQKQMELNTIMRLSSQRDKELRHNLEELRIVLSDAPQEQTHIQARIEELGKRIEEQEKLAEEATNIRLSYDKLHAAHDTISKNVTAARTELTNAQGRLNIDMGKRHSLESELRSTVQQVETMLGSYLTDIFTIDTHSDALKERFVSDTARYRELMSLAANQKSEEETLESDLRECDALCTQILLLAPQWSQVDPLHSPTEVSPTRLLSDTVAALIALGETERVNQAAMADADIRINEFIAAHPECDEPQLMAMIQWSDAQLRAKRQLIAEVQLTVHTASVSRTTAAERLATHLAQRKTHMLPDVAQEEMIPVLRHRATRLQRLADTLYTRLIEIELLIRGNHSRSNELRLLTQRMEAARKELNHFEPLCRLIGDASGKRFRAIALSYILAHLVEGANRYITLFTDRYTLEVEPSTFIINVIDSYQGYVRRACNTISGGETFLVSLSLALALSDIGELSGCDTLFIDEGFGSLSGQPLARAVETLRTLHTRSGRRVGIISHVAELLENIPIRICVSRQGETGISTISIE